MSTKSDNKTDWVVTIAREAISDALPGVLSVTQVAEKVAQETGMTAATARKYLRSLVAEDKLLELKPSQSWYIKLPGSRTLAGDGIFLTFEPTTPPEGVPRWSWKGGHYIPTRDNLLPRPSHHSPGNTTYLTTPENASALVRQWKDEDAAQKAKANAVRIAGYKADRAEIDRRAPGLRVLARQIEFLLEGVGDEDDFHEARVRLYSRNDELPVQERPLTLAVQAQGPKAGLLRTILEAGFAAYLADQTDTPCTHCGQRILPLIEDAKTVWWHLESTVVACTGTDTKATPKGK